MAHWIGKEIKIVSDKPSDFQPDGKKCDYCECFFEDAEIHETVDKEDVCSYCIDDHDFVRCDNCGAVFEKEETMTCVECGHQIEVKDEQSD